MSTNSHHFYEEPDLDPNSHQNEKKDPVPNQSEKPDPDPHLSQYLGSVEAQNGVMEAPPTDSYHCDEDPDPDLHQSKKSDLDPQHFPDFCPDP